MLTCSGADGVDDARAFGPSEHAAKLTAKNATEIEETT
jgi:hypothetical protein